MKNLSIIGCKCWPNTYGGFESLVENLLRDKNFLSSFDQITIYVEEYDSTLVNRFSNVKFVRLPVTKSKNPLKYYFLSLYLARNDDFNLILGLAAGISLPFFKIFNRRTQYIVNVDGIEWQRSKFGVLKRILLYLLNILSIFFSHKIISDSRVLSDDNWFIKYKRINIFIPYSSRFEGEDKSRNNIIAVEKFVLAISRFVPENNIEMICEGWSSFRKKSNKDNLKFVFIGDFENYVTDLPEKYPSIDFVGPLFDLEQLGVYFESCSAYIHGHSVGGTNPVLVEAISKNCNIFAHDNIYNNDTLQEHGRYFSSCEELAGLLALEPQIKDLNSFYETNFSNKVISKRYIDAIRK